MTTPMIARVANFADREVTLKISMIPKGKRGVYSIYYDPLQQEAQKNADKTVTILLAHNVYTYIPIHFSAGFEQITIVSVHGLIEAIESNTYQGYDFFDTEDIPFVEYWSHLYNIERFKGSIYGVLGTKLTKERISEFLSYHRNTRIINSLEPITIGIHTWEHVKTNALAIRLDELPKRYRSPVYSGGTNRVYIETPSSCTFIVNRGFQEPMEFLISGDDTDVVIDGTDTENIKVFQQKERLETLDFRILNRNMARKKVAGIMLDGIKINRAESVPNWVQTMKIENELIPSGIGIDLNLDTDGSNTYILEQLSNQLYMEEIQEDLDMFDTLSLFRCCDTNSILSLLLGNTYDGTEADFELGFFHQVIDKIRQSKDIKTLNINVGKGVIAH